MKKERRNSSLEKKEDFVQQEMLQLKRVTKVTKGGRRFHFTSLMLVKDNTNGMVGFSLASGNEVSTAIKKAVKKARKNLVSFSPIVARTVPHDIFFKFKSTRIMIKPAPVGNGIKAGSSLASIFKFIGIKDVTAKVIGSNNRLNVTTAGFLALKKMNWKKSV